MNPGDRTAARRPQHSLEAGEVHSGREAFSEQSLQRDSPADEGEPLREEAQIIAKLAPRAGPLAALPPQPAGMVLDSAQRKREQVQRCKQVGQP